MQLNSLTEEYIKTLHSFSSAESILDSILKKRNEVNDSILALGFGLNIINNDTMLLQNFRKDLKFIEEGINGSWKDDLTSGGIQKYYLFLQKKIKRILENIK